MLKLIYCLVFILLFFDHFHSQQNIKSVKKDIYCYDVKDGCIYQDAFNLTIDSIYKIDSTFFNSRKYYIIIELDGRYNELHLLISNGMKSFSILDTDLNKVDSLVCQSGISKYWSLSIKEKWKDTLKSFAKKSREYDDAYEPICLIVTKKRNKFKVKHIF